MSPRSRAQNTIRDRFLRLAPQMILLHWRVAKEVGLSDIGLQTLHLISLAEGPVSPSELSDRTGLPRSTMTRVLTALEAAGYVIRSGADDDGRRSLVTIRPEAAADVGSRFDVYAKSLRRTNSEFSTAELAVIARYWERLVGHIESDVD